VSPELKKALRALQRIVRLRRELLSEAYKSPEDKQVQHQRDVLAQRYDEWHRQLDTLLLKENIA
jgi:hypothetical protein